MTILEDKMCYSQDYIRDKMIPKDANDERESLRQEFKKSLALRKDELKKDTASYLLDDGLSTKAPFKFSYLFRPGPKLGKEDEDRKHYLEWKNDLQELLDVKYVTYLMIYNTWDMESLLEQYIKAFEKRYPTKNRRN
jgi:hypothetical protein